MKQAHRPGGITPAGVFFCPVVLVLWVWCTLWGVVRRFLLWACWCTLAAFRAFCGLSVGLWALHCAAVLPSYLKRIFDRFFQEIRNRTTPGRGLAVRLQSLHQLTTEPSPPAAHKRHSIHQQNQPQQAPADNTSKDTTARNSTEPPTPK